MNKKIAFKHITGSLKFIPGLDDRDLAPRMVQKHITSPEAGKTPFPIQELVQGHVVNIVLVDEDYIDLTPAQKKLPSAVVEHLEKNAAEEMLFRIAANQKVRDTLQHLARTNEIEIIGESELDPEELLKTAYPIVSLSEIAQADWESRGIPIPAALQGKGDTERARAKNAVDSKMAAEKTAAEEAKLLAEMEAEEAAKKKPTK